MKIIISKPRENELNQLGVKKWPIWEKEESNFDWFYDEKEVCYFLDGDVVIEANGEKTKIAKGDLVIFPQGLKCKWQINKKVKKHYKFGE